MHERDFLRILDRVVWKGAGPAVTTPGLVDKLVELGIVRHTRDGRIHVPDIYLFGFGLKRRGGVRRPRRVQA
jgi:hypothetical protein